MVVSIEGNSDAREENDLSLLPGKLCAAATLRRVRDRNATHGALFTEAYLRFLVIVKALYPLHLDQVRLGAFLAFGQSLRVDTYKQQRNGFGRKYIGKTGEISSIGYLRLTDRIFTRKLENNFDC